MATTALFVEILIVGLEAAVWLVLLGLTLAGSPAPGWSELEKYAKAYKDWATLVTAGVLGAAYVVGIIVDRLAETAHRWFEGTRPGTLINWYCGRGSHWYGFPARVAEMRLAVMNESEGIAGFLDYQRSRVRIVRATVVNVALALLFAGTYVAGLPKGVPMLWSVLAPGLLLLAASVYASEQIHAAYLERLSDAYCLLKHRPLPATYDAVAAAICYRRGERCIEFLLVRTKGGPRWTFPKGHIEGNERARPWDAAAREAREEAGVTGECLRTPIAYYLYPKPDAEDRVAAYLLEARHEEPPAEAFRDPRWLTAEQALQHLAEGGREHRYVREHARVLRAAERRLAPPPPGR